MSNVSFSSSASQREGGCFPQSFSQFIGLDDLASIDDVDYVSDVLPQVYSKGAFAAYHAYLRKFDAGSTCGSVTSASSAVSVASGRGARSVEVPAEVKEAAVPAASKPAASVQDEGYCFLQAFKVRHRATVARAVGSYPCFYQLMALPMEMFDLAGRARVSVTTPDRCHVSLEGSHCFFEAMKQVAARFITASVPGSAWDYFRARCEVGAMGVFSPVMVVGGAGPATSLEMTPESYGDVPLSGFAQAVWTADIPEGSTYDLQFVIPGLICRGDMLLYADDYRSCVVNGKRVVGVRCVRPGDLVNVTVARRGKAQQVRLDVDVVPVGLGPILAVEMTKTPHKRRYFRDNIIVGCNSAGDRQWFTSAMERVISSLLAGSSVGGDAGDYLYLANYPSVRAMDNCTLPAWVQFLRAGWFAGRSDDEVNAEMSRMRAELFPSDTGRRLAANDLWLKYGGSEAAFQSGPAGLSEYRFCE